MAPQPRIRIRNLSVSYGDPTSQGWLSESTSSAGRQALKNINLDIPAQGITAIIGPSGCGKSTLLKSLNRLLEETEGVRVSGEVWLLARPSTSACAERHEQASLAEEEKDINIYAQEVDVTEVRTRIGLLAPKPFPLPMSIYDNVAYGPRIHGRLRRNGKATDQVVECYLQAAGLWDEVHDRLRASASGLSTGQQQRLCLARTLAVEPEVLLCDEPTSALDPLAAQRIEAQLQLLKDNVTIVVVTHLLRQARRLADTVVFLWMGELVEVGPATEVFSSPADPRTRAFLQGEIG